MSEDLLEPKVQEIPLVTSSKKRESIPRILFFLAEITSGIMKPLSRRNHNVYCFRNLDAHRSSVLRSHHRLPRLLLRAAAQELPKQQQLIVLAVFQKGESPTRILFFPCIFAQITRDIMKPTKE